MLRQNKTFFIGDSQIREDIDCILINEDCYNLGIEGITPTQIALFEDKLIAAQPKKVIIGLSPLLFNEQLTITKNYSYL